VTAVAGGLVSSTAVTLSFARRSREGARAPSGVLLAGGILLAWVVMFGRVVVEVAVVNRGLLPALLVPLASMAVAAALGAGWLLQSGAGAARSSSGEVPLENPFSLRSAIRFALLFAGVLLVVALVQTYLPGRGIYAVAALAGLGDVDAITLSMASCALVGTCTTQVGVTSIVIAALANTLVKAGMVAGLGASALRGPILAATAAIVVSGLAALWLA
jgi:uncharacterized membrane protein (DUF4010 family)